MGKYTSRKLWFFVCLVIVSTWLLVGKHIPPEVWAQMVWACSVGFAGGNVGEYFAKRGQPG